MKDPIEILLVEDNPDDIEFAREALDDGKILNNLHVTEDGDAAMKFLLREGDYADAPRPQLILLDLNLPREDGREVLREIKSNPDLRRIPIVILTTSDSEADVLKAYDMNANCYIKKPVDMQQFFNVVRVVEEFWFTIVQLPPT